MRMIKGFTLIELMIVIAIVAILAAIAIPSYQDYVARTKLVEGFSSAMAIKAEVGGAFFSRGASGITSVADQYQNGNNSTRSKYVQYIEVADDGVISAYVSATQENGLPVDLDGKFFTLTPQVATSTGYVALSVDETGRLDWACASASHVVAQSRGMLFTDGTLPSKYLPAECR